MANRHLARSIALQTLFEWDFRELPDEELPAILRRHLQEFAPGLEDDSFAQRLIRGVAERRARLDLVIEKAAPDWPITQVAAVDRNILRLGLYELLFVDRAEVPAKVAINEAIELAKTFGGETSSRFVNGVLGAVYRELGEPGKDEVPAKKKHPKDIPYEKLPIERLGGAVVYSLEGGRLELALVHDIFGYWTLSKGHLQADEKPAAGVAREVKEELSLKVAVGERLGENEYISSDPAKGKVRKQVGYFMAEAADRRELHLNPSGGLDGARWFTPAEVVTLRLYDDVVPFITKAIKKLSQ